MPFVLLPISQARIVSAAVTIALLVLLGFGRAQIAGRSVARTIVETVAIGVAAALAGVAIGVLINRAFGGREGGPSFKHPTCSRRWDNHLA
jgi:VIT1/CCC1 family predicted Fe2+/Mn2+ transporter